MTTKTDKVWRIKKYPNDWLTINRIEAIASVICWGEYGRGTCYAETLRIHAELAAGAAQGRETSPPKILRSPKTNSIEQSSYKRDFASFRAIDEIDQVFK